ncbi:hypothetical protein [Pandoraea sputorum]|uniref:hypothetical protein n=1 Tax=Pandoraea sputorum TaxID=93222 RepID=UPI002F9104C5
MTLAQLHAAIRAGSLSQVTGAQVSPAHVNKPLTRRIEEVIRRSVLADQRRPNPTAANVELLP